MIAKVIYFNEASDARQLVRLIALTLRLSRRRLEWQRVEHLTSEQMIDQMDEENWTRIWQNRRRMNRTRHMPWLSIPEDHNAIIVDWSLLYSFLDPAFFSMRLSSMTLTHWNMTWSMISTDSEEEEVADHEQLALIPSELILNELIQWLLLPLPDFHELLNHDEWHDDDDERLSLLDLRSLDEEVWEVYWCFLKPVWTWDEGLLDEDDVIMLSADPILIVNSQDQEALDVAHVRTEIAMSSLTIGSHSAPDSLVKYAIMASLPSPRMDMCHLSEDVKHFASSFKTSGASFDFKRFMETKAVLLGHPQWCRVQALSTASCASGYSSQGVMSPTQLEAPSESSRLDISHDLFDGGSLRLSWITSIISRPHHLHDCVRHRARRSSSALWGREPQWGQVTQPQAASSWSPQAVKLHGRESDHVVIHARSKWAHVKSCSLPVSISDRFVSETLSLTKHHLTGRLNDRIIHALVFF